MFTVAESVQWHSAEHIGVVASWFQENDNYVNLDKTWAGVQQYQAKPHGVHHLQLLAFHSRPMLDGAKKDTTSDPTSIYCGSSSSKIAGIASILRGTQAEGHKHKFCVCMCVCTRVLLHLINVEPNATSTRWTKQGIY